MGIIESSLAPQVHWLESKKGRSNKFPLHFWSALDYYEWEGAQPLAQGANHALRKETLFSMLVSFMIFVVRFFFFGFSQQGLYIVFLGNISSEAKFPFFKSASSQSRSRFFSWTGRQGKTDVRWQSDWGGVGQVVRKKGFRLLSISNTRQNGKKK